MEALQIMPIMAQNQSRFKLGWVRRRSNHYPRRNDSKSGISFLEANTDAITMNELANKCVVPTWANQELTIAHQDFISCVHDAASSFYAGEPAEQPRYKGVTHCPRQSAASIGKESFRAFRMRKDAVLSTARICFYYPNHYRNGKRATAWIVHRWSAELQRP